MADPDLDCALNQQVAERIFGITALGPTMVGIGDEGETFVRQGANPEHWHCQMQLRPVMVNQCVCEPPDGRFPKGETGHNDCCLQPVPGYASNPSAMIAVIDRMRELGWDYCSMRSEMNAVWICGFRKNIEDPEVSVGYFTESLTRAVCLAALQAVASTSVDKRQ